MKKISFIGLGTMGYHMAGHLSKLADVSVSVYNRSQDKAVQWGQDFTGEVCIDLSAAVAKQDVIFLCLGRDEDVLSVVEQAQFMDNLATGAVVVDHTTASFDLAKKLHDKFTAIGAKFIDAPISGGEAGAINGLLSTMLGGSQEDIAQINALLISYCKSITHIGEVGYGQLAKMVNQICIAGVLQGLSEGIRFAEKENLDIEKLLIAISGGAAQSWQMENRGLTMNKREFDFGFAIKWMIKDLGYCLNRGEQNGSNLSMTQQTFDKYVVLASEGHENEDTSTLICYDKS